MSLNAATVIEIRHKNDFPGASDTNGGGFSSVGNTGTTGTDYSFTNINADGSAKYALTDGHYVSGSTILLAEASADMIGNICYIAGGTGSMTGNWYQIINVSVGVNLTLDRGTGLVVGTGMTVNIGGALATPGGLGTFLSSATLSNGMRAFWKYSTSKYIMTVITNNVSGGILTLPAAPFSLEGYDQVRGDRTGNRPIMMWGAVSSVAAITYMITGANALSLISNITVDGTNNGITVNNVGGINLLFNRNIGQYCISQNFIGNNSVGFNGSNSRIRNSKANNCFIGFSGSLIATYCWADGILSGVHGFFGTASAYECISNNNIDGFNSNAVGTAFIRCIADSNTVAGFTNITTADLSNCIASNHTGGGIGFNVGASAANLTSCAVYNNGTHIGGIPIASGGFIILKGDPYISKANKDYRLNDTYGRLLKSAGLGVFGQIDNVDIGATQHQDITIFRGRRGS